MNLRLHNKKGTTLIEILVTLVIIAIGIFSVVQLFSGGFVVLKRGENITFAERLAEKEFERIRARSDSMPLGITVLNGQPSTVPGMPLNQTNIYNIRHIIGETVKIPGPSLSGGSSGTVIGSVYQVAFAPIGQIEAVYSSKLQRRVMDSTDTDNDPQYWLRPTQYAIDYEGEKICFRASPYDREFSLSFSVWVLDGPGENAKRALRTVNSEVITVPANAGWIPITAGGQSLTDAFAHFLEIDDRSDQVSRAFTLVPAFSKDDPYEYVILDPLLGRIAFNPIGYAYREDTPQGKRELAAHVDYTVADWGIVAETLQVPEEAPLRLRTTLRNLKQNGITINDDGSLFSGLINGATGIGGRDFLIVDEATGGIVFQNGAKIDYINGLVDFDASNPTPTSNGALRMAGRTVRVYYRAQGDWRVLPQKAYEHYTSQDNRGVSFREYFNPDAEPNTLYFNELDASKTFSIDYIWKDGDIERTVIGEVQRASDGIDVSGSRRNAVVKLKHDAYVVRAVRGVSMKIRVLWSEGSRVDDGGSIVNSWQHYDMDGELTRTVLAL